MTLRERILGCNDLKAAQVQCPEWGCAVTVKEMTVGERADFEATVSGKPNREIMAWWVAASVRDDDGKLLFEQSDVPQLLEKSADVVLRIWDAVARLNGLTKKDVDEIAGN